MFNAATSPECKCITIIISVVLMKRHIFHYVSYTSGYLYCFCILRFSSHHKNPPLQTYEIFIISCVYKSGIISESDLFYFTLKAVILF